MVGCPGRGRKLIQEREGALLGATVRRGWEAGASLLLQPRPPDHPVVTQDAFPEASGHPLDSSPCQTGVAGDQSVSPDLSEAADSVSHLLSSLSSSLLAGFLTGEKKTFARLILTTKDMFLHFFSVSPFSISIDSTCCNCNTSQLNIKSRSQEPKAVSINGLSNIEVFNVKMVHFVISYRHATAQNGTQPACKKYQLARNTCPQGLS